MEQLCPYCGSVLSYEDQCTTCQSEVAWVKKCYFKSDDYYTKAYAAAKQRKLTTAKKLLEKAIYFNKYNIAARNLLGLIYCEIGEVALGLKAWIVSSALEKEDNIATEYINKVQSNPKVLETYNDSSSLYNKALKYLKQGNEDVAIIRLKKAVSINPKFIEARVLLALCYIQTNKLRKAHEQLREALKIDRDHTKALEYLERLKHEGLDNIQSYEQEYAVAGGAERPVNKAPILERNNLFLRYTLYFLMGVLCMWIAESNLVTPSKISAYKEQAARLQNEKEAISTAMDTLKLEHEEDISKLQAENDKLKSDKTAYEETMGKKNQQEKLLQSEDLIAKGDYEGAAEILYNIAPKYLSEEENANYIQLRDSAYNYASSNLCNKGYSLLQSGAFSEAKMSLETALLYASNEQNKKRILYYLGCSEQGLENDEKAMMYFNEVIDNYPNTTEALWSEERLNEIKSQG